jgi:hypothetical protein
MTEDRFIADPHGLLASGEPLGTIAELATAHGLGRRLVRLVVHRRWQEIRYVDVRPHRRYHVGDFAAVVEQLAPALAERAKRIAETEAADAERGRQRREREAEKKTAPKPPPPAKKPKAPTPPPPTPSIPAPARGARRGPSVPEVITIARRAAR